MVTGTTLAVQSPQHGTSHATPMAFAADAVLVPIAPKPLRRLPWHGPTLTLCTTYLRLSDSHTGVWCNGSTADSGSACLGSNPSTPAPGKPRVSGVYLCARGGGFWCAGGEVGVGDREGTAPHSGHLSGVAHRS